MDLLPISWEKGFKGSRILGFKCLFYRNLIIALSILSTSPLCIAVVAEKTGPLGL